MKVTQYCIYITHHENPKRIQQQTRLTSLVNKNIKHHHKNNYHRENYFVTNQLTEKITAHGDLFNTVRGGDGNKERPVGRAGAVWAAFASSCRAIGRNGRVYRPNALRDAARENKCLCTWFFVLKYSKSLYQSYVGQWENALRCFVESLSWLLCFVRHRPNRYINGEWLPSLLNNCSM